MKITNLSSSENILIFGYGREGKATEKFIKKYCPNTKYSIYDQNIEEYKNNNTLENFDTIILSPGVPPHTIPTEHHKKITTNTNLFFENITEEQRKKTIGITGSKGKSTTSKFLYECLQCAQKNIILGGNIGIPLTELYEKMQNTSYDFIICELSSYQLEFMKKSPGISFLLNIFPEHLNWHETHENYTRAKNNIWKYQKEDDVLLVPHVFATKCSIPFPKKTYITHTLENNIFPKESSYNALHFRENFGTIMQFFEIFSLDKSCIYQIAKKFIGLPHRLEYVCEKNTIHFYNDSISVNTTSTTAAIKNFKSDLHSIILDGMKDEQDISEFIHFLQQLSQDTQIICIASELGNEVYQKLQTKNCIQVNNLADAMKQVYKTNTQKHICLFSPGGKSYDKYKNFEERGNAFKEALTKQ